MTRYEQGFMSKCAYYGIPDDEALALYDAWRRDATGKVPFPYDVMSNNPRIGHHLMPAGLNWRRGMVDERNLNGSRYVDYYPLIRASLARQSATLHDESTEKFLDSEARRIANDFNLRASSPEDYAGWTEEEEDDAAMEALRNRYRALSSGRMKPGDRTVPDMGTTTAQQPKEEPPPPPPPAQATAQPQQQRQPPPPPPPPPPVAAVSRPQIKASAYAMGFLSKCAEYGVDGRALLKLAQTPAPAPGPPPVPNYNTLTPDQKLLVQMLYDEARQHPADMPYIAATAYNRAGGTDHIGRVIRYPNAYSGLGRNGSFASMAHRNDNDAEKAAWREAIRQAMAVYGDGYRPPTTATHFHAPNVSPSWKKGRTALPINGVEHSFYDDVEFERPWSATAMPALSDKAMEYIVAPGDNFDRIGRKLGGIPARWLQAWNRGVKPERMKIGSRLAYMPLPDDYVSSITTGKKVAAELEARRLKAEASR